MMKRKQKNPSKKMNYDAISCLPDEILAKIISLLPTKRAASTSLLSRRWRTLFPLMNNQLFASQHHIHLDESDLLYPKEEESKSFKSFVEKTLSGCGSNMKKLTLKCLDDNTSLDVIDQWIQKASEQGLVDLALYLEIPRRAPDRGPGQHLTSVFTNKTLVKLALGYPFFYLPIVCYTVFLPVLKSLSLRGCEVLCPRLLTGCPILEELSLYCVDGLRELGISHKTLKRLTVHGNDSLYYDRNRHLDIDYCLTTLDTPSLVYLDYSGYVALLLAETTAANFLDSLVEAKLDVGLPTYTYSFSYKEGHYLGQPTYTYCLKYKKDQLSPIIDRMHNVRSLYMSPTFVEAMKPVLTEVPLFINLVKLSFESDTEQGWEVLPHMLNKSPKLETLLLKGLYCVREEGVVCVDPKQVKVLEIYGFRGLGREFRQLKSFSCQVMKVEIKADDDNKKLQVISRLVDFSSKCQINLL